jgi:hypothetical protein
MALLCMHCNEPIVQVNYGLGMTWAHVPHPDEPDGCNYYFCRPFGARFLA